MQLIPGGHKEPCAGCAQGKMHQTPHPLTTHRNRIRLEEVHMELIGKMPIQSRNKKLHMLVILDDVSCYSWVYGLHGKSDAAHQIQLWMAEAERQSG